MKMKSALITMAVLATFATSASLEVRASDEAGSSAHLDDDHDHHGHSHEGHHGHAHSDGKSAVVTPPKVEKAFHPTIPAALLERIDFVETFQDGPKALEKGWISSKNERYFRSEWVIASTFSEKDDSSDKHEPAFEDEKSLAVNVKHQHYGLTHVLETPFDNTGKTLVFQYEVRYHDGVGCSGAYAKLLLKQDGFDALALEEASPYVIMFGPDKCGATNKVHFIVRQKLANNKWEEKHMSKTVPARTSDSNTHLYTLIIRPDNSFEVKVDSVTEAIGSLTSATDFTPPFGAPKEIDDPTDKKPSDWVDVKEIDDPSASKPADWDEDAPKTIPDPDAKKPEGWDDEEDGEWQAPEIPNPEYKGKWIAPRIANPAYKGEWKPKRIPNPDFFEEEHPSNLAPIGAISFEILANDRGIAFDNILLTHDENSAKEFADLTFQPKQAIEKARTAAIQKAKERQERLSLLESGGPYGMLMFYVGEMRDLLMENLIPVAVSVAAILASLLYFCCWPFIGGATGNAREDGNEEDDDDEDETAAPPVEEEKKPEEVQAKGKEKVKLDKN